MKLNSFLILLLAAGTSEAFVGSRPSTATRSRNTAAFVTKKQQEQLDKWGPTPETSIEIFFDKLTDTPDFMLNAMPKQWKGFVKDLRKTKEKKQAREEERQARKEAMMREREKKQEENNDTESDNVTP